MEFDKKKLSFFIIAIIAIIMLSRYYLQIFTLSFSLVFLWYSAKKQNAFLLTVALLGGFIGSLIHQKKMSSREGFQNTITTAAQSKIIETVKSKVPQRKCEAEQKSVTRITVEELTKLEYMFNVFFGIPSEKARRIFKRNCIENIFDAMISSHNYKQLNPSEQVSNNWHIRNGIMDKIRDLYHIYNFSIQNVNIIINKNKLDFSKISDGKFIIEEYGFDSIQKLSLDYFLQNKKFVDKQFKILEYLGILKSNDKLVNKIRSLKPAELYYNQQIKELCGLMVCFENYNIITPNDLKTGYNSGDLTGDKWVVQTLEQVKLDDFSLNTDPLFKKYKIRELIIEKLAEHNKEKTEEVKSKLVDFSKAGNLLFEQLDNQDSFETNRGIQNREIKEYEQLIVNNSTADSTETKLALTELADVNKLRNNTVGTLNSIVDDTRKLITEVGTYETNENDKKSMKSYVDKYIKFFVGFTDILVKEQRAFFVGIILVVLSIITNFIEVTKN